MRDRYNKYWSSRTDKQVQKELLSMRKYLQRHSGSWELQNKDGLCDGDKVVTLSNILKERGLDEL